MLRRIVSGFRRQDWTAVAIELVVVVVGVFMGVQASNWNEQRETDQRAAVFTDRLKSDLREEAWGYEYYIEYYREVLANAEATVDALTGSKPLSDEALLIDAYRASQFHESIRRRATFDELTSTGEIGLVRDRALRELAMRTYKASAFDDIVREGKTSRYRAAFRMAIPYDVQRKLAQTCGDRVVRPGDYKGILHSLDYPCSTGLPADVIAENVAILRGDVELVPLLRMRISDVDTNLGSFTVYNKDIRDGLRGLAREQK
ncbi:MAG: DUF6090 family protein [Rhodanobacteraceae bacterium]